MATTPYDPPPSSRSRASSTPRRTASRASRRDSLFDEVRHGLDVAEHYADAAGKIAGEVGKAAHIAQQVEDDIEQAYRPGGVRCGRAAALSRCSVQSYGGTTTEGETDAEAKETLIPSRPSRAQSTASRSSARSSIVPYESASTGTRQRKKPTPSAVDLVGAFSEDVDARQEAVDALFDDIELVAIQRHRLTGTPYSVPQLFAGRAGGPPRSRTVERDEATKLAALVGQAKADLLAEYKRVCALQPRSEALKAQQTEGANRDKRLKRAFQSYTTLNSSFASLLDFVEDRAKEEKRWREAGAQKALLRRIKEDHPDWERSRRKKEMLRARDASAGTTLETADLSSCTGWWLLEHPFTELDTVLQSIDLAENGIKNQHDEKKGSWELGTLLSHAIPSLHRAGHKIPKSRSARQLNEHELRKSRRYRSEEKTPVHHGGEGDTDPEDEGFDLLPKKEKGKDSDDDDSIDLSQLPERVPTDDTSGYQESREELIADAKAQRRTEQIAILVLYLYWGISRALGNESPLGNVDLGSHLGNSAWNDTSDGLVYTSDSSTESSTSSASSVVPHDQTGLATQAPLGEVLASASRLSADTLSESIESSGSVSASATSMPTASPTSTSEPTSSSESTSELLTSSLASSMTSAAEETSSTTLAEITGAGRLPGAGRA
ncbi:hypothetical protein Rhopal_004808-T1 [Rhodotorula paludigena]|uniref:Uncharacterized protein n=1 Tax=Rhodotorula paludigena TaxID=86838 RepID=A0AAV5GQJ4_9BASI|nr:hypothetical protein Rhopal_004808-T1 [Rhodotorula paludigena]